jgi:hypothetical protein
MRAGLSLSHRKGAALSPIVSAVMAILDPPAARVCCVRRVCGARADRSSQRAVVTPTHLKGVPLRLLASVMTDTVGPTVALVECVHWIRGVSGG